MGDLDKLIAAVEAGTFLMDVFPDGRTERIAYEAFGGSLDAALRLHEALLPGSGWVLDTTEAGTDAHVYPRLGNEVFSGDAITPARAWLLAILRALQAQSTPPISPEEAQFNAVRYHERFGPLDEKGNPLDPRRRG